MSEVKPTLSRELARKKYQKALNLIDQALNLLRDARSELSPLVGGLDQYYAVGVAMDSINQLWRDIAYSTARDTVDLDADEKRKLMAEAEAGE